ncbi:hypothetical protein [Streptomyces sp. NPDC088812]|uniref:hypothetical protein n=1 Tax=Streptomyces sp. NPDC088812 TaxID=3365905 RepID=UPI003820CD81
MVGRSPEEPEGGSSLSDDALRAFLEESERGADSAPKEPSARARMVTERLRRQGEPEGWRTGPAWRELDGRAARRRKVWSVLGVAAALGLLAVALKPSLLPGDLFGAGEPEAVAASPLPPETAAPTGPPAEAPEDTPTLDRPFAGSPALDWADGEAGVVLPAARAVGSVSEERVAQALRLTRQLLVGANLDEKTLRGGRPTAAFAVLDPLQPELVEHLDTSLSAPDEAHDPLELFSRFDPEEVRLVGDVVKTRGRMTFGKGEYGGVAVHADYTFVYPVVRTDGSTEVTRTIVRRVIDAELADPARYQVTSGRLLVRSYDQDLANSACEVHDGFLHPQFATAEPTGPRPSGPATDPYDRSKDVGADAFEGCGTVSRV